MVYFLLAVTVSRRQGKKLISITGNGDEEEEANKSGGEKVHSLTMYSGGGSSPAMDISCTLLVRNKTGVMFLKGRLQQLSHRVYALIA